MKVNYLACGSLVYTFLENYLIFLLAISGLMIEFTLTTLSFSESSKEE